MREVTFHTDYVKHPAGSCLAVFGDTKVLCTAGTKFQKHQHHQHRSSSLTPRQSRRFFRTPLS